MAKYESDYSRSNKRARHAGYRVLEKVDSVLRRIDLGV